ncbi:Acyl carrier protein [bioreactor metagenome]|uniref:Acyl carrier protein n=1 Tax=bioreactor metagenome TaxID=1076179 RepID=A0A645C3E5_9ZZZZ|nr:acyl carrier protein [Paludibacter sp.]
MTMEIEQRLKAIFCEVFNIEPEDVTVHTKQNDLESWNSLGQLRLIMEIESSFDISFSIEQLASMNTFQKILQEVTFKVSGTMDINIDKRSDN